MNPMSPALPCRNFVGHVSLLGMIACFIAGCASHQPADDYAQKYSFGSHNGPNWTQVAPSAVYSIQSGFGFEPGTDVKNVAGAVTGGKPFFFSVALPEGNYKVRVTLGNRETPAETTVRAELRRLMLQQVPTKPGEFRTLEFTVNLRRTQIAGGGQVHLKEREMTSEKWAWDDRLTLEFAGQHPSLASLEIKSVDVPTVFLLGDSTVCDQPAEPFNSWGQMLTRFFKPEVAVANHAESGETIASSLGAERFNKVWSQIKPGDYLFVQFGHNDMKSRAANALETYTESLRKIVDDARSHGATPVLCTSVSRRTFDANGKISNSFGGYTDAVRQVAKEKNAPLIDLQAAGAAFYEAMGPDESHKAFANARENTHHSDYGSFEIAKCVGAGIQQNHLPLAKSLVDDFKGFDPSHPDPFDSFKIPISPLNTQETPAGN